jgi:type II secretory pathway pseudopilin PulG
MKRRTRRTRREREGGFALLLVFVMAAVIAITLYMEFPRLAFDTQRQREQLLMERGQQYQIAIRRYMQRGMRGGASINVGSPWPGKIEDLENTNGRRFLRKRYIDPMTGKDEWRIIHINNGILTDSLNNKAPQNNKDTASSPSGIADFAGLGQAPTTTSGANLAVTRRRPSDNGGSGGSGTGDPNQPGDSGNSSGASGNTPVQPGNPAVPGDTSSASGSNSAGQSNTPGIPGMPANSNFPGGVSPFPQPGGTTAGGPVSPANLINNLLTQPRNTGMPQVMGAGTTTIGGGIAGVASNLDADSIMVCGDHTNYKEWEFIFDPSKWRAPANPNNKVLGTPIGNSATSSAGSPSSISTSTVGSTSGTSGTGGASSTTQNRGAQMGGNQGAFGNTCGMEARPGVR